MTDSEFVLVRPTTLAAEGVLERGDLQRLLRDHVEVVVPGVKVVAEEFAAFEDARRRIDLLGVDRDGNVVVVELKRTSDGGHLELQALRYAAMVSAMTFDDLASALRQYRETVDPASAPGAREELAAWLEAVGGEDAVPTRRVRIVLVSGGFDVEITTAVLWLTEVHGLDIRCVRLTPHRLDGRLLVQVDQVIPLPEAAELKVRLRRREEVAQARESDGRDLTRFVVTTPAGGATPPLRKRQAVREAVVRLHAAGVTAERLLTVVPKGKLLAVTGAPDADDLPDAMVADHLGAAGNLGRWFLDTPLRETGTTWVLSKMWGADTAVVLDRLLLLAPGDGWSARPVPADAVAVSGDPGADGVDA